MGGVSYVQAFIRGGIPPSVLKAQPAGNSAAIARLFCNVQLWRLMQWPVGKTLAAVLLLGKPIAQIYRECLAVLRRLQGFLLAPVRAPWARRIVGRRRALRTWHLLAVGAAATAVCARALHALHQLTDPRARLIRAWCARQAAATNYTDWCAAALKLDELRGIDRMHQWRADTRLYDRRLLQTRLAHLRGVLERGDIREIVFAVRVDLLRNLGNITNSELHETSPLVPEPIQDYIKQVQMALRFITEYDGPDFPPADKLTFLRETRHAFGRTALVLSGGGGLGAFHLGVVKALFDHKLLPRVLSGSSVGSIVCAILAVYNDEELKSMFDQLHDFEMSFFSSSTATDFFRHLLFKGTLHDHEVLTARLRKLYGDTTFLEAYIRTGRILNVVVTAADTNEPPRLLNYLTAPHVLVWSAVSCSSAFPYLYEAQDLYARNHLGNIVKYNAETVSDSQRRWRDGSLEEDLPMRGLSEQFNVNYYIVSQTNPHIVPLMSFRKRLPRTLYTLLETEFKHRCTQAMTLLSSSRTIRYICKLFNQPWEGDITMVLPASYNELRRAIVNPTRKDLAEVAHQGQLEAFAKLSAVQCNCAIEMTLDECMARVTSELMRRDKQEAQQRGKSTQARIPSWLNLKSFGIPSVSSNDSLSGVTTNGSHSGEATRAEGGLGGAGTALHGAGMHGGVHPLHHNGTAAAAGGVGGVGLGGVHPDMRVVSRAPSVTQRFPHHTIEEDVDEHESPAGVAYAAAEYTGVPTAYQPPEYDEYIPFDCCDRSINVWETLLPLVSSSAAAAAATQGLDFIAP